ncbi:MAG: ABC transporter ATP-binding protein [Thermoplasmata archaeon]|nr:ABC transporter ATP-binding protein [Thermoplasmata archaeon]
MPLSPVPPALAGRAPLAVEQLTVRYGEKPAVNALTFTVRPGEIYGLLGSNGAGKSSTIKSVVGLVKPLRGTIRVFGVDPDADPVAAKRMIGYVPESTLLFDALTPREFLEYVANVRRLPPERASARLADFATAFQIEGELEHPLATLSNGTRQKVIVIAALLHEPPLLVLDEPLNNLDPRSVRIVKELLTRYVGDGRRGVMFSTHTMEVAEQLCHRVGILDRGELKGEGSIDELRRHVTQGDPTLESIFLKLTQEEEGVRDAVRTLTGG